MSDYAFITEIPSSELFTGGTATVNLLASWRVGGRSNSSSTTRQQERYTGAGSFLAQLQTPFRQDILHVAAAVEENGDWATIDPAEIEKSVLLINRFMDAIGQPYQRSANPHISSDGEGGITFEWWKDARSLTLFTRADGSSGLLLAWGVNIEAEMDSIEEPTDAQMREYWRRLTLG